MTYAHIIDVPIPIEGYDAVHRTMIDRMNGEVPPDLGLLVHIGRASESGFQVIEVWESKEAMDRAFQELVIPVIDSVNPNASAGFTQRVTEFEIRGMVLAGRQIVT